MQVRCLAPGWTNVTLGAGLQCKYSGLANSELAKASFFGRSSCLLEISMEDEGGGGQELLQQGLKQSLL